MCWNCGEIHKNWICRKSLKFPRISKKFWRKTLRNFTKLGGSREICNRFYQILLFFGFGWYRVIFGNCTCHQVEQSFRTRPTITVSSSFGVRKCDFAICLKSDVRSARFRFVRLGSQINQHSIFAIYTGLGMIWVWRFTKTCSAHWKKWFNSQ